MQAPPIVVVRRSLLTLIVIACLTPAIANGQELISLPPGYRQAFPEALGLNESQNIEFQVLANEYEWQRAMLRETLEKLRAWSGAMPDERSTWPGRNPPGDVAVDEMTLRTRARLERIGLEQDAALESMHLVDLFFEKLRSRFPPKHAVVDELEREAWREAVLPGVTLVETAPDWGLLKIPLFGSDADLRDISENTLSRSARTDEIEDILAEYAQSLQVQLREIYVLKTTLRKRIRDITWSGFDQPTDDRPRDEMILEVVQRSVAVLRSNRRAVERIEAMLDESSQQAWSLATWKETFPFIWKPPTDAAAEESRSEVDRLRVQGCRRIWARYQKLLTTIDTESDVKAVKTAYSEWLDDLRTLTLECDESLRAYLPRDGGEAREDSR